MPPVSLLDGFGPARSMPPARCRAHSRRTIWPIPASRHSHPPGLYGAHEVESALNVVHADDRLAPLTRRKPAGLWLTHARALEPYLLAAAMLLLLLDALLSLWLRGICTPRKLTLACDGFRRAVRQCAFYDPQARADDAMNMKAALDTRLAYVKTGLADVDSISQAGLTGLGSGAESPRTSYEPIARSRWAWIRESDDLSLYPLLYWPLDPREKSLSPKALSRIGDYMRNGGTILFDTRDFTLGAVRGEASPGEQTASAADGGVGFAAAGRSSRRPCPEQGILYPAGFSRALERRQIVGEGLAAHAPKTDPEVSAPPARSGGDGVSPVIIGGNDWASAWAVDVSGHFHGHAITSAANCSARWRFASASIW